MKIFKKHQEKEHEPIYDIVGFFSNQMTLIQAKKVTDVGQARAPL